MQPGTRVRNLRTGELGVVVENQFDLYLSQVAVTYDDDPGVVWRAEKARLEEVKE